MVEEQHQSAFELATSVFVQNSQMHRALKVTLSEYQLYLRPAFDDLISEGLSIGAVEAKSNRLIGCMIVGDYSNQLTSRKTVETRFDPLVAVTEKLRSSFGGRNKVEPGQIALIDMGAVLPGCGGKGIYKTLRNKVHEVARQQGFIQIAGELSSAATQHVVINLLGHQPMARLSFREYEFAGTWPFASIDEPEEYILAIGDL